MADRPMGLASALVNPDRDRPADSSGFLEHAGESFRYQAFQVPVNGITQLVDHVTGTNFLPSVQVYRPPNRSEFGSSAWAGDMVGGTLASAVHFSFLHRMVGPGAAASLETRANYGLGSSGSAVGRSLLTGLAIGGIFTPVENEGGNFYAARFRNAGITGLSFAGVTAGSISLKSMGNSVLAKDWVAAGLGGLPAGALNADLHAITHDGRLATWQERSQGMANYAIGGSLGGATNMLHEYINPTSGIRGIRTAREMSTLADTTKSPNAPPRYAHLENQVHLCKAEELLTHSEAGEPWYQRTTRVIRQEIEGSSLSVDQKKMIVSSHQEMSHAFEALASRPNPKPMFIVYGSARFEPGEFRFERSRYIGGRAVQEGFDVMCGGAPKGAMGGANQGAYEAGGNSIGITIKLPFENADIENGWHTLTVKCRNFHTRQQILKTVGPDGVLVVEEGGLGTGAEVLDALTHMQTKKMNEVPVYLLGSKTWKPLDTTIKNMLKQGTISAGDLKMYKIVDNPDEIFADLAERGHLPKDTQKLRSGLIVTDKKEPKDAPGGT